MPKMMKNVQQIRTMFPMGRSDDNSVWTTSFSPLARLITLQPQAKKQRKRVFIRQGISKELLELHKLRFPSLDAKCCNWSWKSCLCWHNVNVVTEIILSGLHSKKNLNNPSCNEERQRKKERWNSNVLGCCRNESHHGGNTILSGSYFQMNAVTTEKANGIRYYVLQYQKSQQPSPRYTSDTSKWTKKS